MREKKGKNPIVIIGAGPAGTSLGYFLAGKGFAVEIYEEHNTIGNPVQCTGILSGAWKTILQPFLPLPKTIIANTITTIHLQAGKQTTSVALAQPEVIVWRNLFDQWLAQKAKEQGVLIKTNHKMIAINEKKKEVTIQTPKGKTTKAFSLLIGADGPRSKVRAFLNQGKTIAQFLGMQAIITTEPKKQKMLHDYWTFFDKTLDHSFGWIVPETPNSFRVGITILSNNPQETKKKWHYFLKQFVEPWIKNQGFTAWKIEGWQSGFLPVYDPHLTIFQPPFIVVGDAATHVKATTFGGILPSIKAAEALASLIGKTKAKKKNKDIAQIHNLLEPHRKLRKVLNSYNQQDFKTMIIALNNPAVQHLLKHIPRDKVKEAFTGKALIPFIKAALIIGIKHPFFSLRTLWAMLWQ